MYDIILSFYVNPFKCDSELSFAYGEVQSLDSVGVNSSHPEMWLYLSALEPEHQQTLL